MMFEPTLTNLAKTGNGVLILAAIIIVFWCVVVAPNRKD